LNIPIRHVQHLKHIKVGCFSNPNKNLSRSELLASSDALGSAADSASLSASLSFMPRAFLSRLQRALVGASK